MKFNKLVKSNQEQATAAWIDYLKQIRIDQLNELLAAQKLNLSNALQSIDISAEEIYEQIINTNRGGTKGIHGFIAEAAEYGIENAKKLVEGKTPDVAWINDNGPVDLIRGTLNLQLKFTKDLFSLNACIAHLKEYPDYLKNGGEYMIPKDYYETVKYYYNLSKEKAMELSKSPDFSLKTWNKIQDFFAEGSIPFNKLNPAELSYEDSQVYNIDETLENARNELTKKSEELEDVAKKNNSPSFKEGFKAAGISALVEGTTAFALAILKRVNTGKSIKDLSDEDWIEIAKESGYSIAKGAARGATTYVLTNHTNTPSAIANGIFTASFAVAEQIYQFSKGTISKDQLIQNSEKLCIETSVSSVSAMIGQTLIPIPVLGAIIGNSVGNMLYSITKDCYTEYKELTEYALELQELDENLSIEHQNLVKALNDNLNMFTALLEKTYAPNPLNIIDNSAKLAAFAGVPINEILDTPEKARLYFQT